jgi:hypothetical protein
MVTLFIQALVAHNKLAVVLVDGGWSRLHSISSRRCMIGYVVPESLPMHPAVRWQNVAGTVLRFGEWHS